MQMLLLIWHMREGICVRCDDSDDVLKIRITMTMTMTTLWITPSVMVLTTMAMAVALFFLSQLCSVFSDCPKSLQSRCAPLCLNWPEAADSRSPQAVVGTAPSEVCGGLYL